MAFEASSSSMGHEYEVFLSFMGEDTRKGFTDHLYHHMIDAGVRVFKDNVDLPDGEEIGRSLLEGIKKSKIAMPIFSKNYAASRWCLDELVCMLECRTTRKQTVLPIFYDVTPSQVKKQTKKYALAFSEHAKKYDEETVEKWRKALAEAGSLKGLELEKETGGHEGKLAKMIVTKILSELKRAHLFVTDNLVGIDDQTEAVRSLLEMWEKDVSRVVMLWGIGGVGKTTLAKFVYNLVLDEFNCSSFLKDIREISRKHNGLERLQGQLVSDLSRKPRRDFATVEEGTNEIKCRFQEKKVLILLDDIDHINQVNVLAADLNWFGRGSRIIVTTRNRSVLNAPQVGVYEVKQLNQYVSLQLFCKHAFRQDTPGDEFGSLSHDIVKTAGGLPLALEVIGSYLSRKSKPLWQETLEKLKRAPKEEVQERLKISLEGLDDEQKHMFLDVACLFIGEDIDIVIQMWKDRTFSAEIGKDVLLIMCLIKIGDDNKIWMHDQLRDLGRDIVRKENCNDLGKQSRLWCEDDARKVLENQLGSQNVEALCLRFESGVGYRVKSEQLRAFSKLRFLQLYHADLAGNFRPVLHELRWLKWKCSSELHSPTSCSFFCQRSRNNLNLKKLVVLDLSFSWITHNWQVWSSIQRAVSLKVLNLTSCTGLRRTPDLSMFINLERLILDYCYVLEVIDPSIGKLENLVLLSMKYCQSVKELPIGSLPNLQRLLLANSGLRKLPDSIGKLKSLTELDLSYTSFPTLPSSVCDLKNLQLLNIYRSGICRLPNDIVDLDKLQLIDDSVILSSDRNISKKVWTLGVSIYLELIKSLDGSEALQELQFSGRQDAKHHDKMRELGGFEGVETVQGLDITKCGTFGKLPMPSNLKFLRFLDFHNCGNLQDLEGLGKLKSLQELHIRECRAIAKLPNLSNLKSLKILNCSGCEMLQGLEGLDELEALQELHLRGCSAIEKLPSLSNLKFVRRLNCDGCVALQEIEGLDRLEALQELLLGSCREIKILMSLSNSKFLTYLNCNNCENLQDLEGLDELEALQELDIRGCRSIEKLPSLSNLKFLKILNCSGCEMLQELGLDGLEALQELHLRGCKAIKKLLSLSELKVLKILDCVGCENLGGLEGIEGSEALRELHLRGCGAIEKLPNLSNLKFLRKVDCDGCEALQEIEGLDGLRKLQSVCISRCKAIRHIPNLPQQMKLKSRWLNISGCKKYKEIHGNREFENFCSICQEFRSLKYLHLLDDSLELKTWLGLEELEMEKLPTGRESVILKTLKIKNNL